MRREIGNRNHGTWGTAWALMCFWTVLVSPLWAGIEADIALHASQWDLLRLDGNQPAQSFWFQSDQASSLSINILTTVPNLITRLRVPGGTLYVGDQISAIGGVFVTTSPSPPATSGSVTILPMLEPAYHYVYVLPSPPVGVIEVQVEGVGISQEEAVLMEIIADSPVRTALFPTQPTVVVNDPAVLIALLYEGSTPIAVNEITVEMLAPSEALTGVSLFDNGLALDVTAGDGMYTGVFFPDEVGKYIAVVHIYGVTSLGTTFGRVDATEIEVIPCGVAPGVGFDCNRNLIPDQCDIAATTSLDGNTNGIPDECESDPPTLPPAAYDRKKNRYISFTPSGGAIPTAFRVDKLTAPTGSCWVQAPVPAPTIDEFTATCDSTPVYRVWNEPVIHVGDCEIIPVADYEIRSTFQGLIFSPPLAVSTIMLPTGGKWWGDSVGSNNGSEWTPPNRISNVNDVTALLAFISGAAIRPHFTSANLQAISAADPCLNAQVNASDVLIAVQAVAGASYGPPSTAKILDPDCCPPCPCIGTGCDSICPPGISGGMGEEGFAGGGGSFGPEGFGPASSGPEGQGPGVQGLDGFTSVPTFGLTSAPYQINAGATATVNVYLDAAATSWTVLSAYEVSLDVEGGTSGTLTREAITINTGQSDFIFAGHNVFQATNADTNVAGAVEGAGVGVLATNDEYLATYTFRASADAYGVFEVRVSDTRSFLLNDVGNQTAHDASAVAYVRVGVECTSAIHCDDGNQCTSDACTNGECVNANSPSGTACNDGLFCTLTDTCNGGGICVGGAATPCVRPNPVCCENYDSCHPTGYTCELE